MMVRTINGYIYILMLTYIVSKSVGIPVTEQIPITSAASTYTEIYYT